METVKSHPINRQLAAFMQLPGHVAGQPLTGENLGKFEAGQQQHLAVDPQWVATAQPQQMQTQLGDHMAPQDTMSAQFKVYTQPPLVQVTTSAHKPDRPSPTLPQAAQQNITSHSGELPQPRPPLPQHPLLTPADQISHFNLNDPRPAPHKGNKPQNYVPEMLAIQAPPPPCVTSPSTRRPASVRSFLMSRPKRPEITRELQALIRKQLGEFKRADMFAGPSLVPSESQANTSVQAARPLPNVGASASDFQMPPTLVKKHFGLLADPRVSGVHVRAANSPQMASVQMAPLQQMQPMQPSHTVDTRLAQKSTDRSDIPGCLEYSPQNPLPDETQEQWRRRNNPALYRLIEQQRAMQTATQRIKEQWEQAQQGLQYPLLQGAGPPQQAQLSHNPLQPQAPLSRHYQPTIPQQAPLFASPQIQHQQVAPPLVGAVPQAALRRQHQQPSYYQIPGTQRVIRAPPGLVHPSLKHQNHTGVDLQRLDSSAPCAQRAAQAFGPYSGYDDRAYTDQVIVRGQEQQRQFLQQQAAQQHIANQQLYEQRLAQQQLSQQQLYQHHLFQQAELKQRQQLPQAPEFQLPQRQVPIQQLQQPPPRASPFEHQVPPHLLQGQQQPPPRPEEADPYLLHLRNLTLTPTPRDSFAGPLPSLSQPYEPFGFSDTQYRPPSVLVSPPPSQQQVQTQQQQKPLPLSPRTRIYDKWITGYSLDRLQYAPVRREDELNGFLNLDWPYNLRREDTGFAYRSRVAAMERELERECQVTTRGRGLAKPGPGSIFDPDFDPEKYWEKTRGRVRGDFEDEEETRIRKEREKLGLSRFVEGGNLRRGMEKELREVEAAGEGAVGEGVYAAMVVRPGWEEDKTN